MAVILAVLMTICMFSPGLSIDSRGTSFITAFPENVAYYYKKSYNQLKITSLHEYTEVTVDMGEIRKKVINERGKTWILNFNKDLEEHRLTSSNMSVRITSDKDITVLSVSGWWGRFQSHVVQPDQNLGTAYQVPALNYTKLVASFSTVTNTEARYNSFRLLIINAVNESNTVTFKWVDESGENIENTTTLEAYNLFQLRSNSEVKEIKATSKVAVLLTHPCVITQQPCSCNMVLNQLRHANMTGNQDGKESFFVPFTFNILQLLLTTNQTVSINNGSEFSVEIKGPNSTDILPSFPNISMGFVYNIDKPVSLQLISSGLILDLIPKSMFAACFLVHHHPSGSGALVIANKSEKGDVRINNQPLPSTINWKDMGRTGSQFSWTLVNLTVSSTIWHRTSKIAVYMIDRWDSDGKMPVYGGSAIIINADPDPNGCMVTPEMYIVGTNEMSWSKSHQYCFNKADQFARLISTENKNKFVTNMTMPSTAKNQGDGWISLRRDLLTTAWYWSSSKDNNKSNVVETFWDKGQPEKPEKGMCASVSLVATESFNWKVAHCCSQKKPVCFNQTKYLDNVSDLTP
ncbi:uncharacterized protein LOC127454180 [Myxocyprinus asiaticus]|uniref:uncharacterized protein LOC127454180 n=1 Tax=Myxocyprinus asiaticus TaxID=70543 RepID=UPI0022223651|nr:uncharacterized protein LOC127454180 [Myxocyprinus asiaticus]